MQEIITTQNIIQGGGVMLAGYLAFLLYRVIVNHEKHFTDAIIKNTEALTKLSDCIESLKEKIK